LSYPYSKILSLPNYIGDVVDGEDSMMDKIEEVLYEERYSFYIVNVALRVLVWNVSRNRRRSL
jgi:hypothetical protein